MQKATRTRSDSPTKTCGEAGCERPLRARGLCVQHYNAAHYSVDRPRHQTYTRTCVVCGSDWQTGRTRAKYCSDLCKSIAYGGTGVCSVPDLHPLRSTAVPLDHPSRLPLPVVVQDCEWCGTPVAGLRYCN